MTGGLQGPYNLTMVRDANKPRHHSPRCIWQRLERPDSPGFHARWPAGIARLAMTSGLCMDLTALDILGRFLGHFGLEIWPKLMENQGSPSRTRITFELAILSLGSSPSQSLCFLSANALECSSQY